MELDQVRRLLIEIYAGDVAQRLGVAGVHRLLRVAVVLRLLRDGAQVADDAPEIRIDGVGAVVQALLVEGRRELQRVRVVAGRASVVADGETVAGGGTAVQCDGPAVGEDHLPRRVRHGSAAIERVSVGCRKGDRDGRSQLCVRGIRDCRRGNRRPSRVGRAGGRTYRRCRRNLRRVGKSDGQSIGRGRSRLHQELVANRRGAADHDAQAVRLERTGHSAGARHRHERSGRFVRELPAAGGVLQDVIRSGQLIDVRAGDREGGGTHVLRVRLDLHATDREHRLTGVAVEIDAGSLLIVDRIRQAHADQPELVAGRIENLVTKVQHAPERAAGHIRGHVDIRAVRLDDDIAARRVVSVRAGPDGRGHGADHERLAVADIDVDLVVLLGDADVDVLAQLGEQLITLIEQVIRRLAAAGGERDLAVQLCDVLREGGDVVGRRLDPLIDLAAVGLQLIVVTLQLAGQRLGLGQHDLARCAGRRRVGHVLYGARECLQRRRQARRRIREHIVDLGRIRGEFVRALI